MKKLEKLKLGKKISLLNDQEMKTITGGYSYSSYCYPGEKLYSCTITCGRETVSGGACATSVIDAYYKVWNAHKELGSGCTMNCN